MHLSEHTGWRVLIASLAVCMAPLAACSGGGGGGGGGGGTGGTAGTVGNLSVRGSIQAPAFAFVDGDTNDPNNPRVGNNLASGTEFQSIGNPSAVGGYLGPIEQDIDVEDWYAVTLAAGQGVALRVADPVATDFDLYVFDGAGDLVANSLSESEFEWVGVATGGEYLVVVTSCYEGNCGTAPGVYNMTVGTAAIASTTAPTLTDLHPFVEGDVLISAHDQTNLPKALTPDGWRRLTNRVDVKVERASSVVQLWSVRSRPPPRSTKAGGTTAIGARVTGSPTIAAVKALRRAGVRTASPNYIRKPAAIPNDQGYELQWHYPLIGLEQAWDISTGDGVTVAVLDTGIVANHPDLRNQLVPGYDYISDANGARDGNGVDPDPEDEGDLSNQGTSSSFHGTHVAGTIAADTNNSQGVAGVAWGARIMPVRVLGVGGGSTYDICQGMLFAAGEANDANSGASPPADVINMSLGGGPISQCEVDAIDAARSKGIFVVVAAGNDDRNSDNDSLSGIANAITVSAVGISKAKASYSSFGNRVDVAAPGGDNGDQNRDGYVDGVLSTIGLDSGEFDYSFSSGTSMAAPHVAGVLALMLAVNPNLTPLDFERLLEGSHSGTSIPITEDLGPPGHDQNFGHGLIDALGAVRAASALRGVTVDEPIIRADPASVELTAAQPTATVSVRNGGAGSLVVTAATADQTWLQVSPMSGAEGDYQIAANLGGLDDGLYLGTVSFVSNGGSASVSVRLAVGTQANATGGDLGTLYVILLNEQYDSVAQAVTASTDGYNYSMSGVAAGTYAVFAGTDLNNDGFIDDAGEALGGYPTLSEARFIEVTESVDGVNFSAAFESRLFTPNSAVGGESSVATVHRLRRLH